MTLTETSSIASLNPRHLARSLLADNPVLITTIHDALNLPEHEVLDALTEVICFMILVAGNKNERLTPSHRVDLAWHEFILCTKAYQDFCQLHFERMIHHYPGGPRGVHREQFSNTLELYTRQFGPPNQDYWGTGPIVEKYDCGACESF